jgi:twitching motility two-component system response regulator PilH
MHIILIEPDRLLARTYKQALEGAGHTVIVSETAQGGIHAADQQTPELVIVEMQLVSHSGIEFLYEFRSYGDWQHIPAIVLSQVPPAEFIDSWDLLQHELGVQKYLYKPITKLEKLLRVISEFATVKQ